MGKKPKDISEFSEEKQNRILAARRACKKYREKKQAEDSGYLNKIKHANVEYYAKNRDRILQQQKLNKILKKQSQVNNLFQNVANNSITEVSSNNASELNFPNTSFASSQDNSNSFQYIDDNSQDEVNSEKISLEKKSNRIYANKTNEFTGELSDANISLLSSMYDNIEIFMDEFVEVVGESIEVDKVRDGFKELIQGALNFNNEFIDINKEDPLDLSASIEELSTKININPKKKNHLESVISRITNNKLS